MCELECAYRIPCVLLLKTVRGKIGWGRVLRTRFLAKLFLEETKVSKYV